MNFMLTLIAIQWMVFRVKPIFLSPFDFLKGDYRAFASINMYNTLKNKIFKLLLLLLLVRMILGYNYLQFAPDNRRQPPKTTETKKYNCDEKHVTSIYLSTLHLSLLAFLV